MIDAIVRLSVERRYLMLSLILVLIGVGVWSFQRLPIDAVPDITNVQVQINTEAPGYSPLETEQRITFPVETALYGLPSLSYTRSLSRYGLSQVTVVFEEGTDIYFARNLINERLGAIKSVLPPGLEPEMGPIATGLGEIFMYTVDAAPGATRVLPLHLQLVGACNNAIASGLALVQNRTNRGAGELGWQLLCRLRLTAHLHRSTRAVQARQPLLLCGY